MRPHRRVVIRLIKKHLDTESIFVGAEIGVQHGMLASRLLKSFEHLTLFMVDPWKVAQKGSTWADTRDSSARAKQAKHDDNRRLAYERTDEFRRRRVIIEMPSFEASFLVPNQLDWVFIDGDHSLSATECDLACYYKKIKGSGLFMGHDYSPEKVGPPWNFGVVPAVDAFCDKHNLTLHVEEHAVWWAFVTPEK